MGNTDKTRRRFMELEGLRGLAAIVVVIFHFLTIFYGFMFAKGAIPSVQHLSWEGGVYGNPLMIFMSGVFAVAVFFVLSGFVLSIGYFQSGNSQIIKELAAKRYVRLMLPALASLVFCYLLLKLGLSHIQQAAVITQSGWEKDVWTMAPHLGEVLKDGLYGIFVAGGNSYNGVLWTMMTEFAGSFLVFGTLLLFAKSRYRWIVYAALLFITLHTWFLGFVIGMIIADMYSRGYVAQKIRKWGYIATLLAVVVYLGGYPFADLKGTPYAVFDVLQSWGLAIDRSLSLTIGAAILVFLVVWSEQIGRFLRHPRISILGKYTFSLYLIHIPIIFTFTTSFFILVHRYTGYNKSVAIAFLVTVPVLYVASWIFEKYIDSKSVRFSKYCSDIYFSKRSIPGRIKIVNILKRAKQALVRVSKRFVPKTPVTELENELR